MKGRGVIWDMDGVIVDTGPLHFQAWQEVFRKRGVEFSPEDFRHTFGLRNDIIILHVLKRESTDREIAAIFLEKEALFLQEAAGKLHPFPGVVELMASLARSGFQQALATSAPRENVELVLSTLGIGHFFAARVTEKDVLRGKPNPEVFLEAARRLGLPPERCLVIEDAVGGVRGARAAGMKVVAVTNTNPRDDLKEANLVVDSLTELSAARVSELLGSSA